MELGAHVHAELVRRGQTISSAESLTGGAVADALTAAPGASESYVGGVVSYATRVKTDLLDVPASVVEEHGVVSAPCAAAMARGVRSLLGTDWAVSTTGVAGPDTQEGQPVGRVYVGVDGPSGTTTHELQLEGDRAAIRDAAVRQAVEAVLLQLQRGAGPTTPPEEPFRPA
ncbi:MAG TPA: CinA family protein [Nocardioides sp.]